MSLNSPIVRGDSLSEQVLQRVTEAILTGELAAGTKIKEAELARQLGVSRGPLREAMGRLEAKHLIERTNTALQVVEPTLDELRDIYLVRAAMEGMACRLAATRMSDAEIDELDRLLDRHSLSSELQAGSSYHQGADDEDFHFRIAYGSRNKLLIETLCHELYFLVRFYRYRSSTRPGRAKDALAEHREIVAALRSRDGSRAEEVMRRHISHARANLIWAAGGDKKK